MNQNNRLKNIKKGKSLLKKLWLVIPALILTVIIATLALYIYSKTAKTTRDDVAAIISTETMPVSERYSFEASSLKMEMSIDKSDIWWIIENADEENIIEDISDNLESMGLTLQSYGLDITDKGILISAEVTYGDFLRFPLKLLTNITINDGALTISPSGLFLGKIRLPIEKFPLNRLASIFGLDHDFSLDDIKYDIPIYDSDLLSMLTGIEFRDNRLIMVYTLDETLFSHSISAFGDSLDWYAGQCIDSIEVLREYYDKGAVGERFTNLVESFSTNPNSFIDFYAETLAVASESVSEDYLKVNKRWLVRIMPEITDKRVSELHTALYETSFERASLFNNLLDNLQTSYNSRNFGIDERGFTYNNKPFDLKSYMGDNWSKYSDWLDASSFRLILINTVSAYDSKTPYLKKITNSRDYIDSVDTLEVKLPIGFIARMKDGTPVLKYFSNTIGENEKITVTNRTVVLDNNKYESMMNISLIPVWKD